MAVASSLGQMTCLLLFLSKRSRAALRQLTLSLSLRHHLMADYDFRPGGSLKLKGGVADGGIVKKYVPLVGRPSRRCLRSSGRRNQSRNRNLTT